MLQEVLKYKVIPTETAFETNSSLEQLIEISYIILIEQKSEREGAAVSVCLTVVWENRAAKVMSLVLFSHLMTPKKIYSVRLTV